MMSFEMESEKHVINMTYDPIHGLTIIGLICPHEKRIEAIKNHVNNFQYDWMTTPDIADWYGKIQEIIQVCPKMDKVDLSSFGRWASIEELKKHYGEIKDGKKKE